MLVVVVVLCFTVGCFFMRRFLVFLCCTLSLPCATSVAFAQKVQVVRGSVADAVSGAPVVGASVVLVRDTGASSGAYTDSRGNFRIRNVPVGSCNIRVSSIGYQSVSLNNVIVTSGKEVVLNVFLTESYVTAADVTVTEDRSADAALTNAEYAVVSARAFNLEDTKRYAGSLGDPSRMAQNFAGVVGANDSRNDIVVRGNSPLGMLWMMDGMVIPNPNHFGALMSTGGPVSILNANVLDKSDFLSSAFPSIYGNATGGVFDLRMRNGNSETLEFLGMMGFNGFEFGAEGPLGSGASFLLNYRYSTLGVFQTLGIDIGVGTTVPNYQDLAFRVNLPLTNSSSLTLFAVGGNSDALMLGANVDTTLNDMYGDPGRNADVQYATGWVGVAYENTASESTLVKITAGASSINESYKGDSLDPVSKIPFRDGEASFVTERYSLSSSVRHKISSHSMLSGGLQVDVTNANLRNLDDIYTGNPRVFVDGKGAATLAQAHVQGRHRLSELLTLTAGIHAQYQDLGGAFAVEPRAALSYVVSPELTVNAGYGMHSQALPIYLYMVESPSPSGPVKTNANLGFVRANHSVLSFDWFPIDAVRVKVEGYYQSLFDHAVESHVSTWSSQNIGGDFGPVNRDSLVNGGEGRNAGVELTAEHFFRNGFHALVTASVFESKYAASDAVWRESAFNTRYVLNVLAGKEFAFGSDIFGVSVRFSTTGGRLLMPLDEAASRVAGTEIWDESKPWSERQSPYLRLDARLLYRTNYAGSTLEVSLDFQNVTDHRNVFLRRYDAQRQEIVTEYQQGFFPIPTVRFTF